LTLTPALQSQAGTTTGASNDNTSCSLGGGTSPDVWYTFTLGARTAVYLSTQDGRTWDSVIHVRAGSCSGGLTPFGCADDSCGTSAGRSQFVGILGTGVYYVAVDGYGDDAAGDFTLYYQGSDCVGATDADPTSMRVDPLPGWMATGDSDTFRGNTTGEGDDSIGSCITAPGQDAPDVYYYLGFCPGESLRFSTCTNWTDFDTVLYARYGSCALSPGGPDFACNDDAEGTVMCPYWIGDRASEIQIGGATAAQGLYFVWVDGYTSTISPFPDEGDYGMIEAGL
jgi:hypothetical protein